MRAPGIGCWATLLAAGALRVAGVLGTSAVVTPDTFDYVRQSRLPLLSATFWGSLHPPLLPLLWKALPGVVVPGSLTQALLLNALIGTVCWTFLAWTLAGLARARAVRWAIVVGVLGLSLAPEVSGWDTAALSESVALSLVALVLALTVRYARGGNGRSAVGLAAAVLAATLARDTNFVLCTFIVLPALLLVRRHAAVLVTVTALAAGLSVWGQHAGHRSSIPTRNAIGMSILRNSGDAAWFRRHGLPWQPGVPGLLLERPAARFEADPRTVGLRRWLDGHGRGAWHAYLMSHPQRTLAIAQNLDVVYDPPRAPLAMYWSGAAHGVFPRGAAFAALVLAGAAGALLMRRRRATLALLCFLGATLPLATAIWDADAVEYQRHAAAVPIVARVALLALALLGAEDAYTRLRNAAVSMPKYVGAS
jgi:hypothetical protein